MDNSLLEEKRCIICGCNEYKIIYKWNANFYDHDVYETCSWDGRQKIALKIVQCTSCGLMYTRPSFRNSSLDFVYPKDIIPDICKQENFTYSNLNISKHIPFLEIIKVNSTDRKRLVDIGTRYGDLPYLARKENFEAYGIEYNKASINIAKTNGREYIFHGTIEDLPELNRTGKIPSFEIVTMDDVLEHLVDANKEISIISSLQKAGDIIIMRQMDSDSLGHRLYGKNWYYLQPAAHMFYFNSETASKLLKNNGYTIIDIAKSGFLSNFLKTMSKEVKSILKMLARKETKWKTMNGKFLYLSQRKRSSNDMFTIIAMKI